VIPSAGFRSLQAVIVSEALLARLVHGGRNPVPGSGLTTTVRKTRGPGDKGLARVEAEVLELLADRQPVLMHFNAVDQLGDCAVTSYGRH
jgi:hypothetical protein